MSDVLTIENIKKLYEIRQKWNRLEKLNADDIALSDSLAPYDAMGFVLSHVDELNKERDALRAALVESGALLSKSLVMRCLCGPSVEEGDLENYCKLCKELETGRIKLERLIMAKGSSSNHCPNVGDHPYACGCSR